MNRCARFQAQRSLFWKVPSMPRIWLTFSACSLLAGCCLICAAQTSPANPANTPRSAIVAALTAHHFDEALRLADLQVKQSPKDPTLWTLRAVALDDLHRTTESLDSFTHALNIDPRFLPALQGAAQTSYRAGDPHALDHVRTLLAVDPASDVANAMAGALTWQARDCASAIRFFGHSNDQVYRDPRALDEYADCLLKQQQPDLALTVLTRGTDLHPGRSDLLYNLAVAQLRTHHAADAIKTLAPFEEKKDPDTLNLLAAAYSQNNQPDDAFRVLESAIEIKPDEATNYLDLAILCLEHNQEERSIKAATAGISRAHKTASLYLIRGVAHAQLSQYEDAEKDFAQAAEIEPNQPHSTIALSMLYSDRNQLDKEKALLTQQLKATPNDPVANYLLADLLMRSGAHPGEPSFVEAKAHLKQSLAIKPDSAEAQILMGHLLEAEANLPEAVDHYTKALQLEPDNRGALDRQFLLLRKLHRNDEAAQALLHLKTVLNHELEQETAVGPGHSTEPAPSAPQ